MKLTKLALSVAVGLSLVGCGAGDAPYDEVAKPKELLKKDVFDTSKVYMYMPSMSKAPRYAVAMAPFMQGQEQLVRLNFSDSGLHVRAINPDVVSQAQLNNGDFGRWNDSDVDNAPLLTIPGAYSEYRCKLDAYDECTNAEEENTDADVEWHEKSFFTPDFANVKKLAATWNDFSQGNQCYSPVGEPRLTADAAKGWKGYEVSEDGSIFIEVEQEYSINKTFGCLISGLRASGWNIGELSFTVAHTYSIVPIENLASKDYEPVLYSVNEEDTFGFFASSVDRATAANIDGQIGSKNQYLHRFNPNLAYVDYHLSDSFNNNESTLFFKQITIDVMNRINPQLQAAGVPQVKVIEPSGKHSGDLRYNVINLIDEPLQNGLAGYGPSAANPVTGEIVHAHINQYSGVLESGANFYWDTISSTYNRGATTQKPTVDSEEDALNNVARTADINISNNIVPNAELLAEPQPTDIVKLTETDAADMQYLDSSVNEFKDAAHSVGMAQVFEEIARLDGISEDELTLADRASREALEERVWSENNMFPAASLWTSTTAKALPTGIAGHEIDYTDASLWVGGIVAQEFSGVATEKAAKLKKWSELSTANQVKIGRVLAGISYAKTLVHELGHNLGLRHNFKGSIDASNFFSQQQAKENGLIHVPAYSSIMDYNPSILDALPVFGPYDLAALQFGYKREVAILNEDKSIAGVRSLKAYDQQLLGQYLDLNTPIATQFSDGVLGALKEDLVAGTDVKPFDFCTDGNVSGNSDCNRHDEGRNHDEINKFAIQRYKDFYEIRNLRNNREDFNEYILTDYMSARENEFRAMRDNIELLSRAFRGNLAVVDQSILTASNDYTVYVNDDTHWSTRCTKPAVSSFWEGKTPAVDEFLWDIYCGVPAAVERTQKHFIDVISQPDHTCEVKDSAGEITYPLLADLMANRDYRDQFAMGEVPLSCFNETLTQALANDGKEVLAESGRFLNSGRAPVRNPNHKYSSDRDYLGTWPDKLVAMGQLVERTTWMPVSDRQSMALADLSEYRADPQGILKVPAFKQLLKDMVLQGKPTYPAKFTNAKGEVVATQGTYKTQWNWKQAIEALPLYSGCLSWCYGLSPKGENNLIEALLEQVMIESRDSSFAGRNEAEALARYVSIRTNDSSVANAEFWEHKGKRYAATVENALAHQIIVSQKEIAFMLSKPDLATLTAADFAVINANKYVSARTFYLGTPEQRAALVAEVEGYKAALEMLPVWN